MRSDPRQNRESRILSAAYYSEYYYYNQPATRYLVLGSAVQMRDLTVRVTTRTHSWFPDITTKPGHAGFTCGPQTALTPGTRKIEDPSNHSPRSPSRLRAASWTLVAGPCSPPPLLPTPTGRVGRSARAGVPGPVSNAGQKKILFCYKRTGYVLHYTYLVLQASRQVFLTICCTTQGWGFDGVPLRAAQRIVPFRCRAGLGCGNSHNPNPSRAYLVARC